MPIKSCKLPNGGSGYQWGNHGRCYANRKDAETQAAAAYANGYAGKMDIEEAFKAVEELVKTVKTP